jgi:NAD(P)-dependent dehydrogenase (short-subunit alcohol dehydrogenase family)
MVGGSGRVQAGGRLAGEVAVVTGATSGLGREIGRVFALEGARVALSGRDQVRGESAAGGIRAAGGDAVFVPCDLTVEDDCRRLVAVAAERLGAVTVLVNNAVSPEAIAEDGPVGAAATATWRTMFEVNLLAPALLCREVIPHMRAAGHGSIVNISSRAAERGTSNLAAYTATKGGLNALARSITVDHARDGIRCNTIQPGYIEHERRDAGLTDDQVRRIRAMQLTRMTTATDVAMAAVFLASREAEVITGITLPVDGGSTAARGTTLG